jgi:hypothetical protein
MRTIHLALTAATISAVCGCGSTESSNALAGTYVATVFNVAPTGQAQVDVLAAGGSLTLTIASDNSTTGNLSVPASANSGVPFTASMAGTVSLSGSIVRFQQSADTFVRDLDWTRSGSNLIVVSQVAGGAAFTLTLTRQ